MTLPADGIVLERVQRNTAASLDAAFLATRAEIIALCRPIVGDEAEDVAHDAYLVARSRLGQLRDPARSAAWLTKIAINICFQRRRRRGRLARLLPFLQRDLPAPNPDLPDAIRRLPSSQRTIVVLFYGHDLSVSEISKLLDQKPATVRSLLFRARGRLRVALEAD